MRRSVWVLTTLAITGLRLSGASITWTNLAGGNWNATANWSPNQVPTAADDVYITNNGVYTVVVNATAANNSLTLGGATGSQVLVSSAAYSLAGLGTVNTNGTFVLPAGTFSGAGDLVVSGTFAWSGGALGGSGTVTILPGGTAILNSGAYNAMTGRSFINQGITLWTGGGFYLNPGVVFSNAPGGTFTVTFANASLSPWTGAGGSFINQGWFRTATNATTTSLQIPFINAGAIDVQVGTLALQSPAGGTPTHTGSFNLA